MPYKPYVQFHTNGTICSCIRKIKLITPIETMQWGNNKVRFCKVYTFQEYLENKKPIIHRGEERMIAFEDIAQTLQDVDYVNHEIGLTYFTNNKYENVIIRFDEINRNHTVYYHGFGPAKISEWSYDCEKANEKLEALTKTEYVGHIRRLSGINGGNTGGLHSLEEVLKAREKLKLDEFIELAIIKHYGLYKKYTWYHIKRYEWYRVE